jgi:phage-related tail protein
MEEEKKNDKYGKPIKVSNEAYERLQKVADSYGLNLKKTADGMINYFYVTGEDPLANRKDNMVKSMKQLQNTVVSFIREHETRHLEKIVGDFEETRREFSENLKAIPTKEQFSETFKKVVNLINENSNTQFAKLEKQFYEKLERDNQAKMETVKTVLQNLTNEAEKRNGGVFKKEDFTDLLNQLKAVISAIR